VYGLNIFAPSLKAPAAARAGPGLRAAIAANGAGLVLKYLILVLLQLLQFFLAN
jgi:hypothetical protein